MTGNKGIYDCNTMPAENGRINRTKGARFKKATNIKVN
jgi:hypothetical protein